MSSMDSPRHSVSLALRNGLCGLAALVALSMPTRASDAGPDSDGSAWDRARAQLIAGQQGPMALAISRWELLTSSNRFGFSDYAGFLLSYPGFPEEERLRRYAEAALDRDASAGGGADVRATVAYFDRQPPLTNPGRARYALALRALGRPDADAMAKAAWRGGPMSDADEAAIQATWGATFTPDDADARMDALLWAGATDQANRAFANVSPLRRGIDGARLMALQGLDPFAAAAGTPADQLNSDPGFLYARARELRKQGQGIAASDVLGIGMQKKRRRHAPPFAAREHGLRLEQPASRKVEARTKPEDREHRGRPQQGVEKAVGPRGLRDAHRRWRRPADALAVVAGELHLHGCCGARLDPEPVPLGLGNQPAWPAHREHDHAVLETCAIARIHADLRQAFRRRFGDEFGELGVRSHGRGA